MPRQQKFNRKTAAQADMITEQSWTRSHCCYHTERNKYK